MKNCSNIFKEYVKKSIFLLFLLVALKSEGNVKDSLLIIGIKEAPPFVEFNAAGHPKGLSIDFWNQVNNTVPVRYEFRRFSDISDLISALESGQVDMSINPITVTDQRMKTLDFSQPFYISGTAIARKKVSRWKAVVSNLFSWQFFSALLALVAVIFFFGVVIWLVEKRKNPDQFAGGLKGVGDGFWWSAVTMTTVGYGDKAPVTRAGRLIGLVWMFAAILMISGLTASIASSLTVSSLNDRISSPEDLRRYKVGTLAGSSSEAYLTFFDVNPVSYSELEEALMSVQKGDLDVVVYDRPILRHYLDEMRLEELKLDERDIKTDYYSFSYPLHSHLRDALDPAIVRALRSPRWSMRLRNTDGGD